MTPTAKAETFKSETSAVFLYLLTLNISDEAMFYFCNNNEYVTSNGIDFAPVAFKLVLPADEKSPSNIQIDDIEGLVSAEIKKNRGKKITASVSIVIAQNPDTIERGPMDFVLRNVKRANGTISAELYDFYIYDRKIPEGTYTPQDFPGLF